MKLTNKDKEYLLSIGVKEDNFQQMEKACKYVKYEMFTKEDESIVIPITQEKAIEILGREKYLSGLQRCTFHSSAVRYNESETIFVLFDSYKFLKKIGLVV